MAATAGRHERGSRGRGRRLARGIAATLCLGLAAAAPPPPPLHETFDRPWNGPLSPDGAFRINGPWIGSGGNRIDPSLAATPGSPGAAAGTLALSVAPAQPGQTPYRGAEIQSLAGFGPGYYEVRMQVAHVAGICASFFWIEAPQYGPHEIDVEFLTDEDWLLDPHRGVVHLTVHPSNISQRLALPFNPSLGLHRYGFLWTPGAVTFTVDGRPVRRLRDAQLQAPVPGYIMANAWTGRAGWGGGPPASQARSLYAEIRLAPGLAALPGW